MGQYYLGRRSYIKRVFYFLYIYCMIIHLLIEAHFSCFWLWGCGHFNAQMATNPNLAVILEHA